MADQVQAPQLNPAPGATTTPTNPGQLLTSDEVQKARDSGFFSPAQINDTIEQQRPLLQANGFTPDQVDEYYGVKRTSPEPIANWYQEMMKGAADKAPVQSYLDAINHGWGTGNIGMALNNVAPPPMDKDAPLAQRVTASVAQMAGDFPAAVAGSVIGGGPESPTGWGAAYALPNALRGIMMDSYKNGDIKDFKHFWNLLTDTTTQEFKDYITGTATGVANKFAPGIAKLPAEVATMVGVGNALEGKMPTSQDFLDAAVVLGGLHGVNLTIGKLADSFTGNGKTPNDVLKDIALDPSIKEDVLSSNIKTPRTYTPFTEGPQTMNADVVPLDTKTLEKELPEQATAEVEAPTNTAAASNKSSPVEPSEPQTPQQKILNQVSVGERANKPGYNFDELYKDAVDEFYFVDKLKKSLPGGEDLPPEKDPYMLMRLLKGNAGRADHFLEHGTYDFKTLKTNGPSYKAGFEAADGDIDGLRAFVTAKRAIEYDKNGFESGFDLDAAKQVVKEGKEKFTPALNIFKKYHKNLMKYAKDSGLISEEAFNIIESKNQDYAAAFQRDMGDTGTTGTSVGKGLILKRLINRVKGSNKKIIDPFESGIKNTYFFIEQAEKNRALQALVGLKDLPGGEKLVTKSKPKIDKTTVTKEQMAKYLKPYEDAYGIQIDPKDFDVFKSGFGMPEKNQVAVMENGKRVLYDLHPKLAEAAKGLDGDTVSFIVKVLNIPTRWLRAGVTLDPSFSVGNFIRDTLTAAIFSDSGFKPFVSTTKGVGRVISKDQAYQTWLKSGGANSNFVSMDRKYLQNKMQELLTQDGELQNLITTPQQATYATITLAKEFNRDNARQLKKVISTAGKTVNPVRRLQQASETIESATRVEEFNRSLDGSESLSDILKSGFVSREITLDFARRGAKMKSGNMIMAFLNANVQGTDRMVRAFKDDPTGTAVKSIAYLTLPSLALYLANRKDDRYNDRDNWEKHLYWIIPTDIAVFKVKKPQGIGMIMATGVEEAADAILNKNPHAFDDFLMDFGGQMAPSTAIPTAMLPFVEAASNHNFFSGQPLISPQKEGLLPKYRYQPYTTELTKKVSSILATLPGLKRAGIISPPVIDDFVRSWSGTLGTTVVNLTDTALRKAGVIPNPIKPAPALADIPFIRAFVVRTPSMSTQPIQDFYDHYGRYQMDMKSVQALVKEGRINEANSVLASTNTALQALEMYKQGMDNMNHALNSINNNPQISSKEKRQMIDNIYINMNLVAKAGNKTVQSIENSK